MVAVEWIVRVNIFEPSKSRIYYYMFVVQLNYNIM
jgi:hypothetical protein